MSLLRSLVPALRLIGPLALVVCCARPPDRESDYLALAARVAGTWRLALDDDLFHGHPACFSTLDIDMDSPSTATALVTFCGGGSPELSRRVTVDVVHDAALEAAHADRLGTECRLSWEQTSAGTSRGINVQWSEAVYEVGQDSVFYAEDVLRVDYVGPWLAGEPTGAMVIYARDSGAATPAYSPR